MALIQSQLKNRIKDMIGFVYTTSPPSRSITVPGDNGDPTYKRVRVVYSVSTGLRHDQLDQVLAVGRRSRGVGRLTVPIRRRQIGVPAGACWFSS